jgi:WD40 repeat protein
MDPITFDAHGRHAQAVKFTKDSKTLISVGQDAYIRLWSVPVFEPISAFAGHEKSVNSISLSPDESRLVTGSSDGTVRIWSFPEGKTLHVLDKQVSGTFSPDGTQVATISTQGRVHLWDAQSGEMTAKFPALDKRIFAVAYTPDNAQLLVGGTESIFRLQLPNGEQVGSLTGHQYAASLVFSPDNNVFATTGADGMLRFWSYPDWIALKTVYIGKSGVLQIAFHPDGTHVAVSVDNGIQIHLVTDGDLERSINTSIKGMYGVAFSPDGQFLANAAADGKVRVWQV